MKNRIYFSFVFIFMALSMHAGLVSGMLGPVLPESGEVTYYPYQVRAMMPMTGLEINPCSYSDPCMTVEFEDRQALSYIKDGWSYSRDLEYFNTENNVIIYRDADYPNIYIGFNNSGLCEMWTMQGLNPIYTDYTEDDQRGTAQGYHENRQQYYDDDYNSSSRSNSRPTGTCKRCHGSGVDPIMVDYNPGSRTKSSKIPAYTRCPYCGETKTTDHWHQRCLDCSKH